MAPVVTVSRKDWDEFLADFSTFAKRYEVLLGHLDLARTRIEGIRERTDQQMKQSSETLRQVRSAIDRLCDETETLLLDSA